MEDELNLEETVMFMNGEPRQDSSRKTQNWTWRTKYPIFIAVTLLAAALVILTVTFIWHARASGTLEARIASSSFQFCGNQSRKACIQGKLYYLQCIKSSFMIQTTLFYKVKVESYLDYNEGAVNISGL